MLREAIFWTELEKKNFKVLYFTQDIDNKFFLLIIV